MIWFTSSTLFILFPGIQNMGKIWINLWWLRVCGLSSHHKQPLSAFQQLLTNQPNFQLGKQSCMFSPLPTNTAGLAKFKGHKRNSSHLPKVDTTQSTPAMSIVTANTPQSKNSLTANLPSNCHADHCSSVYLSKHLPYSCSAVHSCSASSTVRYSFQDNAYCTSADKSRHWWTVIPADTTWSCSQCVWVKHICPIHHSEVQEAEAWNGKRRQSQEKVQKEKDTNV